MSPNALESTTLSLPSLLRERCRPWRNREALRCGGQSWTYGEILDAAELLAGRLQTMGLPRGGHVACLVERGPSALVAFLGILQSGGVLLPLDGGAPDTRIAEILSQACVRFGVVAPAQRQRMETLGGTPGGWLTLEGAGAPAEGSLPGPREPLSVDEVAYTLFTSGSTGRPKGVQISHGALLHSVVEGTPAIHMREGDCVAQLAPLAFDAAVWEHLAPLYAGATLVPIPVEALASPADFIALVARERITWSYLPPALFAEWVRWVEQAEAEKVCEALGSLKVLLFAGDVLTASLVHRWQAVLGTQTTLMNFYGPTETTVLVCGYVISGHWPEDRDTIPLGRPFGSNRILVLDDQLCPCPPGVVGDLFIGGPQLAIGYLGLPERTAEAFLVDPFRVGGRLYASRDRGYFDDEGELFFAGRRDRQVKIRGKRIELEEVEAHLLKLPGVEQAAVLVVQHNDDKRLIAFVTGESLEGLVLRHALARLVPEYMVPHRILLLDALPLGNAGKVDRQRLEGLIPEEAPQTEGGDELASIWAKVLGHVPPSDKAGFMDEGGDSLLLLRALMMAQKAGYRCTDLMAIHRDNTLAGWRRHLQWEAEVAMVVSRPSVFPLAPIQREMYALRACHPGRQLYSIQFVFDAAQLDVPLLEKAFQAVIRHHPMLRCVREGDSQRVLDPETAAGFQVEQLRIGDLEEWKKADHLRTFEPTRFPLFRAAWLEGETGTFYLGVTFFHPIMDGWSFSYLILQTCSAYRDLVAGREPALPERRSEYSDYVAQIDALTDAPALVEERRWWEERLAEPFPLARLLHHGSGGALLREAFWCSVPRTTSDAVRRRASEWGVTLHRVLLAAYFRMIHKITGQRELLLGNTVAGRPWDLPDIDQVVGCTIDVQPVRVADAGAAFPDLLAAVGDDLDALAAHTRLPASHHLWRLSAANVADGFCWKVIFALDNFPESFDIQELAWPPRSWNPIEPFEVALSVVDLDGLLTCYWNYRVDMVSEDEARSLAQAYLEVLAYDLTQ